MKKLFLLVLVLLVMAPAVDARRKVKKAGEITGNVFRDNEYGYELTIHENWKAKVGKEGENVRLVMTAKNWSVPSDYMDNKTYTKIPEMIVYVDTSSLGAHVFIDSLTSRNFKSGQKSDIFKEFAILNELDLVPMQRTRMEIAGESALMWKAQAKYKKEISTSATSTSGRRVDRSYGGAIAAVKIDKYIVLFHVMTEWEFFEPVLMEAQPMIESLKLLQEEDEG
jgi:hypothetical protein